MCLFQQLSSRKLSRSLRHVPIRRQCEDVHHQKKAVTGRITRPRYEVTWQTYFCGSGRRTMAVGNRSQIIDSEFTQNPSSTFDLSYSNINYEIDLAKTLQKNKATDKTREIFRARSHRSLRISRSLSRNSVWQVKDDDGSWRDFDLAPMGATVSSGAVMTAWLKDRKGKIMFHAEKFLYSIDFTRMTQKT